MAAVPQATNGAAGEDTTIRVLQRARSLVDSHGSHDEAARLAAEGLERAKSTGVSAEIGDALCTYALAIRYKSEDMHAQFMKDAATAVLEDGVALIETELQRIKVGTDQYCEGCGCFAVGELRVRQAERLTSSEVLDWAMEALGRARNLLKAAGTTWEEGLACLAAAAGHGQASQWTKAVEASSRALSLFKKKGDKLNMARALQLLGRYKVEAESNRPTSKEALSDGFAHLDRARAWFNDLGDKPLEALCLYTTAGSHVTVNRPKKALDAARDALDLYRDIDVAKGWRFQIRSLMVDILVQLYDWKGAKKVAMDAIGELRDIGDKRGLVLALDSIVIMYLHAQNEQKGDLDDALRHALEARQLCQDIGDKKWEANAAFNIAQIQVRLGHTEEAQTMVQEAVRMDEEVGEDVDKAVKLQVLVDIYMKATSYDKALAVVEDMQLIYQKCNRMDDEAYVMLTKASCLGLQQEFDKAFAAATEAQVLFQQAGDCKGEADAFDMIHRLQSFLGESAAAEKSVQTAKNLQQDQLAQAEIARRAAIFYSEQDRVDDALKSAYEALALARQCEDSKVDVQMTILAAQAELGKLLSMPSDSTDQVVISKSEQYQERALRTARESLVLARAHGCDYLYGGACYILAQALLANGRSDGALRAAADAEDRWRTTDNESGQAYAQLLAAEAMASKDRTAEAIERVEEVMAIFKKLGDEEGLAHSQTVLEAIRRNAGSNASKEKADPIPTAEVKSLENAAESSAELPPVKALDPEVAMKMAMETAVSAIGGGEDEVDEDTPLMDLGLDSLAAIAFREELMTKSGLNVPSSLVFDYPSLHDIATHLVELSAERR